MKTPTGLFVVALVLLSACTRPVTLEYFEKDDRTRFAPQPIRLSSADINKDVTLETYQDCPGKTVCNENVQFRLKSLDRFVFLKGKELEIQADGRVFRFPDREYEDDFNALATNADGTTGSWSEAFYVPLPIGDFTRLAQAQEVTFQVGPYAYPSSYDSRKNWRILVTRDLLLGTMDEEEKPVYDKGVIREDVEVARVREKALREKAQAAEEETWNLVKDSEDPEDLRFFLEQYPDSPFTTPAQLRLRQLERPSQ